MPNLRTPEETQEMILNCMSEIEQVRVSLGRLEEALMFTSQRLASLVFYEESDSDE